MAEQIKKAMTVAEFEALPEVMGIIELLNGHIVQRQSETLLHQHIVGNVILILHQFVPHGQLHILRASVKLDDENYYQTDVLWVADNNTSCTVNDDGIDGAPDLVVEVISPGTAKTDRGIKFDTYQASGVREYWIIEPDEEFVEVWELRSANYIKVGLFSVNDTFASPALTVQIPVQDIFQ